jgi:hypothetical protein
MKKAVTMITKRAKKSEIHERELVYKILFRVFRDQKCLDSPLEESPQNTHDRMIPKNLTRQLS